MIVLKLGGAALKATLSENLLYKVLAELPQDLVIVHGGGPEINKLSTQLGVASEFYEGQRVTTPEILEIVEMVLAGKINPALVRGLQKAGRPAFGMSGVDGALLECVEENPKLGLVGKVTRVRTEYLHDLLRNGVIPVVSPVGLFLNGEACNVNADLAASQIAASLKAERLIFLTDKDGILDAQGESMKEISRLDLEALAQTETITGGMRVKARAMLEALTAYPRLRVEVMNGLDVAGLKSALDGQSSGTQLKY